MKLSFSRVVIKILKKSLNTVTVTKISLKNIYKLFNRYWMSIKDQDIFSLAEILHHSVVTV